jgi:hypothetical protein
VLHHFDHVERHRALRVVRVIRRVGRLAAVAVAAEVRHDDRVVFGEVGRDFVPRHVRLRRAVNQEQRRTIAAADDVDVGAGCLDAFVLEARREEMERVGVLLGGDRTASGQCGAGGRGGQFQEFAAVEVDWIRHAGILPEVASAFRRTSG